MLYCILFCIFFACACVDILCVIHMKLHIFLHVTVFHAYFIVLFLHIMQIMHTNLPIILNILHIGLATLRLGVSYFKLALAAASESVSGRPGAWPRSGLWRRSVGHRDHDDVMALTAPPVASRACTLHHMISYMITISLMLTTSIFT